MTVSERIIREWVMNFRNSDCSLNEEAVFNRETMTSSYPGFDPMKDRLIGENIRNTYANNAGVKKIGQLC